MQEKISIIIASYNYADKIGKAIESVICQSYKNWELLIIDDGSIDNSLEILKKYSENHDNIFIFSHLNYENKGLKETLKLGITKAKNKYIAFLECDDYWENNYLEEKINVLKKYPNLNFIFNDVKTFGDKDSISKLDDHFNQAYNILSKKPWPRNILGYYIMTNLVPTFSTVMVNKNVLKQCDFNTPIDALLDFWLWTQILLHHKFYYIDKKLTNWMLHQNSYLNTSKIINDKEKQTNFMKKWISLLKKQTNIFSIKYIKLCFYQFFSVPLINKIFRGTIRRLLLMME